MNKKRILYITYFAANEPLLDSRTTPVLREMSDETTEYHLVTFEKKVVSKRGLLFVDHKSIRRMFSQIGIKWHPLLYHKKPPVISTIYDIFIGIFYSLFIAISKGIHYIHTQTTVGAAIAFPVAILLRKKIIYDANGLWAEECADIGTWKRSSLLFKIVSYLDKLFIFRANGVIFISQRMSDKIIKGGYIPYKKSNWNYEIIPSHVDMERFKLSASKDIELQERHTLKGRFVLIYIGSIGTWYMFDEMLDFFNVLKKIIPSALFLIVSHIDKDVIKKGVYKKGLKKEDVVITEALPGDVPRYLSLADAAIFFIKPVFSKEACSPVKLGEYLASGLPVIINSNVGDTEGLVRETHTGAVVTKFNEEEYRKAIIEVKDLIDNERDSLRDRCVKAAHEYLSLEISLKRYKSLYKSTFGILSKGERGYE